MEKIIVKPRKVRGLGNILAQKTSNDFDLIDSRISETTEEVNGENTSVFKIQSLTQRTLVLTASHSEINYGTGVRLLISLTEDGSPVEGETITFYEGNTVLGQKTTDSAGTTYLSIAPEGGLHTYTAEYNGKRSNSVDVTVYGVVDIVVSADNSILSYADGDSTDLHAQMKREGGYNINKSRVSIEFYKCDSQGNFVSTLGTSLTNTSGNATITYQSTGTGDIYIRARASSLNVASSENYTLEDAGYYGNSAKIDAWYIQSEGSTIFKVSSYSIPYSNYSLEIKFAKTDCQIIIGNKQDWLTGLSFAEANNKIFYSHNNAGTVVTDRISTPVASDIWRIEVEGTTIRLYRNNSLIITKSNCNINYPKNLRLYPHNLSASMDYVKVKPL